MFVRLCRYKRNHLSMSIKLRMINVSYSFQHSREEQRKSLRWRLGSSDILHISIYGFIKNQQNDQFFRMCFKLNSAGQSLKRWLKNASISNLFRSWSQSIPIHNDIYHLCCHRWHHSGMYTQTDNLVQRNHGGTLQNDRYLSLSFLIGCRNTLRNISQSEWR